MRVALRPDQELWRGRVAGDEVAAHGHATGVRLRDHVLRVEVDAREVAPPPEETHPDTVAGSAVAFLAAEGGEDGLVTPTPAYSTEPAAK